MEQIIKIKVGDKVIRADGLAGKVTSVAEIQYRQGTADIALIKYEDGTNSGIYGFDVENGYEDFYLIGTTILGNKRPVEELDDRIAEIQACLAELRFNADVLRKQKWRLEYQMNPERQKEQNPNKVKENSDDGNV